MNTAVTSQNPDAVVEPNYSGAKIVMIILVLMVIGYGIGLVTGSVLQFIVVGFVGFCFAALLGCVLILSFSNISTAPTQAELITKKVAVGTSLIGKVCHASVPVSQMFRNPIFFSKGIRFGLTDAVQIAAAYNYRDTTVLFDEGKLECVFRDIITGLAFYATSSTYGTSRRWINDADELFETIANMGVDLDDLEPSEIDQIRFVSGPITRELIKASRGSEPITDEQWEWITKRR